MQQAQQLVRQKKYAEALARLKEADAVPDKSPYESYVIEETRAAADARQRRLRRRGEGARCGARDAHPAAGRGGEAAVSALVQLEYRLKDYAKTVDYAQRYYKEGGSDPEPRRLMAQSYYLENDYADAAKTIRDVLDADARAGRQADEALLLSLAASEFKLKNQDGYVDALEQLVASYPKHEYWVDLCRAVQQKPGFAPRLRLDLDRLEVAAGVVRHARAVHGGGAARARSRAFPATPRPSSTRAMLPACSAREPAAERQKRLADMAKRQSDEDIEGSRRAGARRPRRQPTAPRSKSSARPMRAMADMTRPSPR